MPDRAGSASSATFWLSRRAAMTGNFAFRWVITLWSSLLKMAETLDH
jgi:hypothetical protein